MPTDPGWRIVPGDLDDARIIDLLRTHVAAATADMPRESCHALDVAGLQRPEICFWAIWEDGHLLGVGALKALGGGQGELKSMHVAAAARGRGIGAAMVRHLVALARSHGLHTLNIETGAIPYFLPARRLYARHGFVECGAFEGYRPDPNSVFLTLDLAAAPATST